MEWEGILSDATRRARTAVARVADDGERTKKLGRGASGDTTLLADSEAEKELLSALLSVPGVRVLTEEAGEVGQPAAPFTAIVDPLDGSSNFERGIPFYCTSVAVTSDGTLGGVFVAAVRDLVRGDFFYAERGKGARKNGKAIRTSSVGELGLAVAGIDLSRATQEKVGRLAPLLTSVKRQVHFGASALELCFLAEGKMDAYVDVREKMRVIDFAGGYLIAKESGASITSDSGGTLSPRVDLNSRFSFIASANPELHAEFLRLWAGESASLRS